MQDCGNDSYQGAPENGGAWEFGNCGQRVVRGGSWFSTPEVARVADRDGVEPSLRFIILGFRLAWTLSPFDLYS